MSRPCAAWFPWVVVALLFGAGQARALTLAGPGGEAAPVDPASLAPLAPASLDLAYATEHGDQRHHFAGVLLWDLLTAKGAIGPAKPRERLREVVIIAGADGYAVALSLAELDPAFEGKKVVLATEVDDKPLPAGAYRLAVPGDAHGGRSVHDVVKIEVRTLAP